MNENKNILKLVVPIVAIIIIFESVVLVKDLTKKKQAIVPENTSTEITVNNTQPVFELVFGTENKEMKVGETYQVELNVLSKADYFVDSMGIYLNYDSSAFEVSNLTYDEKLPKPDFSKISESKNLVVVNYLIQDSIGYKLNAGNIVALAKFKVKPLKPGVFDFEVNTGKEDKESATMFIENASGKVLPFSSNKLTITSSK